MNKPIFILYFIGLFLILSSYILFSESDTALRLTIASSSTFSTQSQNFVRIIARDLDKGSHFDGHRLRACWIPATPNAAVPDDFCLENPLPPNGQTAMPTPKPPSSPISALCIALLTPELREIKRACLNAEDIRLAPTHAPILQPVASPSDRHDVLAPSAFLFNTPNTIYILTQKNNLPAKDTIEITQIYGTKATFQNFVQPNQAGISKLQIALQSPADFEFKQEDSLFYASFETNEKNLHAEISDPSLTPNTHTNVKIIPFGSATHAYIDVFDGDAWIDHAETPLPNNNIIEISSNITEYHSPKLLYFQISTSSLPTASSAQIFAVIASKNALSLLEQTKFAMNAAIRDGHSQFNAYLSHLTTYAADTQRDLRDLALHTLAAAQTPKIDVKRRTHIDDQRAFDALKQKQKTIANRIFFAWGALGFILFGILILAHTRAQKRAWKAIEADLEALHDAHPSPKTDGAADKLRALQIALVLFLLLAIACLLFYLMQII